MSSSKEQAFTDLKRLSAMFKGIVALADDLASVSSMEQMANAAQHQLDVVVASITRANAAGDEKLSALGDQIALAQHELTVATLKIEEQRAVLKDEREQHNATTIAVGERIRGEAEAAAKRIIDKATRDAAENRQISEDAMTSLLNTNKAIDAGRLELAEIEQQLNTIRDRFVKQG
jgi:hypothetical protein